MANFNEIKNNIRRYVEAAKTRGLKILAIEAEKSVQLNFVNEGRPDKWEKKKRPDGRKTLIGETNFLQKQTTSKIDYSAGKVSIGNTLPYGKIHNEGGKINRTSKTGTAYTIDIPKREYLKIPESDYPRILNNMSKAINSIKL